LGKIVFITGTDTGAGKTVLTGLLLAHLRATGMRALAMKPFCSGSRADARLLFELNDREVPIETVNPFYFRKPLAPLVAARLARRHVSFEKAVAQICELQQGCEVLLVEGIGGIFVPLGEKFMVRDLIGHLRGAVVLAARNGIGVINQVLLSTFALTSLGKLHTTVVLMGKPDSDISARRNSAVLREFLPLTDVFEIPFLRGDLRLVEVIRRQARNCEEPLAKMVKFGVFPGIQTSKSP
jgi:dethiobiotin synthetase